MSASASTERIVAVHQKTEVMAVATKKTTTTTVLTKENLCVMPFMAPPGTELSSLPPYLAGGSVFHNYEAPKNSSSDGSERKGFVQSFSASTLLRSLLREDGSLPFAKNWFGVVLMKHIPAAALPANISEKDIRALIDKLSQESFCSTSKADADETLLQLPADQSGRDPARWEASLGGKGHFAGVYWPGKGSIYDHLEQGAAIEHAASGSPARDSLYIIVHSDSGDVGESLNSYLVKLAKDQQNSAITLGDIFRSRQYQTARNYAKRRAMRLAAQVSNALGLDRHAMNLDFDPWAYLPDAAAEPHYVPPDVLNQYTALTEYNLFQADPLNKNVLVYYNHTAWITDPKNSSGKLVLLTDPVTGVRIVHVNPDFDYVALRNRSTGVSAYPGQSNPLAAIPIGLGRKTTASEYVAKDASSLTLDKNLQKTFYWCGKKPTSGNWRLFAYKRGDDKHAQQQLDVLLGPETRISYLVPLAVVIPPHERL